MKNYKKSWKVDCMLTGKQKRFLRKQAHHLKPLFQVGKSGVTENMVSQFSDALEKRELLKISILQNCTEDKETIANELANRTDEEIVQIIVNNLVFYKVSLEYKTIILTD